MCGVALPDKVSNHVTELESSDAANDKIARYIDIFQLILNDGTNILSIPR